MHTHTIEHYSAIKKNEIMPSAATCKDLEIIIPKEVSLRKRKTNTYNVTYIKNLKQDTNELIYERNRFTDIENRLVVSNGVGERWIGSLR